MRARVAEVNPRIAIFNIRTMEQVVSDSLWNLNLYRWLMGWFAVLTLVLSAVGLYGVVSHSVTSRRREWAVRLALGSAPADVARIVLMRGVALAAIGVSAGIVLIALAVRSFGAEFPAHGRGGQRLDPDGRCCVDVRDRAGRVVAAGGARGADRAGGRAARRVEQAARALRIRRN